MTLISPEISTESEPSLHQSSKPSRRMFGQALGWVSLLLAISQANAFSSSLTRKYPASHNSKRRTIPTMSYVSGTSGSATIENRGAPPLRFPLPHHRSASSSIRTTRTNRSSERFATRLRYREGDSDDSRTRQEEHEGAIARWWHSVFAAEHPPKEQESVDEYLEFLERRYKRLHDDEQRVAQQQQPKKISVLSWLANGEDEDQDNNVVTMQQQEDALYVLGVAELASEKLLQKHQSLLQKKHEETPKDVVIDATVQEEGSSASAVAVAVAVPQADGPSRTSMVNTLVDTANSVMQRVKACRRALLASEERHAKKLFKLVARTLIMAPLRMLAAIKTVWAAGGGKRTLALTFSAFATVFFLVRPIAEAVVRDGLLDG